MTARDQLAACVRAALAASGMDPAAADVAAAADERFGDYQSNSAMVLARSQRANPRAVAAEILRHLDVEGLSAPPEVAGAGFINFRLTDDFLARQLADCAADERFGLAKPGNPRTIVIDFSSPNIAKPMHVGHIRSTILGDCLARVARFVGHTVITDNHVGDWGTQFGKVIHGWKTRLDRAALEQDPTAELVRIYRDVNSREENDPELARTVRMELVKLQRGDPENVAIWNEVVALSWREFDAIYGLLDITFDERLGESFYNDRLAGLVDAMITRGLARESEHAICVFFSEDSGLADDPLMIRKMDGGFLYATTDLATIDYRIERWNPDAIWYVVGAPQALHFRQIFAAARMRGVTVELEHIAFGSILGEDKKIMRTRAGESVALRDVLDEAITRVAAIVTDRQPDIAPDDRLAIARTVGIGAVKYAELSQHRLTDYVFAWDRMLAVHGNTAPYLQNASVRIQSIFRKIGSQAWSPQAARPTHPAERALAMRLIQYAETVPAVLDGFRPNLLCNFLFELANAFHAFYEHCPVAKAEPAERASRLALCGQTDRTLRHGLALLGIACPERM